MALTPSKDLDATFALPDFALPDVVTGQITGPGDFGEAKALRHFFRRSFCLLGLE